MIQRIAVFLASLIAVAVLVVGLSLAGVGSGGTPVPAAPVAASVMEPAPSPQTQVDTVYVAPPQKPATVVVHKTVAPTGGGEQENEGAGGND